MKLELHHINICSKSVGSLDSFYRDVFDLKGIQDDEHSQDVDHGYSGGVSFLTDGHTEFHLAEKDLAVGHRTGHAVNPLDRGHIAFRTDDIEAFKKRLNDLGVPFSDYGTWAMEGWYQVFFQDPEGTIIEVHQINYKKP
jgi:glyoxylase I family protein